MGTRTDKKEQMRAERLRREAEAQAKERRKRLLGLGGAAALGAICVVAVLIVVSQSGGGSSGEGSSGGGSSASAAEGAGAIARQLQGIPQDGTVLGDPNANVRVVEYGDLQCPVCKEFSSATAPDLIAGVVGDGTASYEFRQFTILGPDSETAARAALAAGEQGRYWNYVELFYRNQGQENSGYVTDSFLESVAKGAGVRDIARWNADRRSAKWDAELSKVQSDAESLGINSTPSVVVEGPGGRRVVGAGVIPVAQIEAAIKAVE